MIKKTLVSLALLATAALAPSCVVFDSLGLSPDRVKGDKAKQMIQDGAMTQVMMDLMMASLFSGTSYGQLYAGQATIDMVLPKVLSGIDDSKYYKKSAVQRCASLLSLSIIDTTYIPVVCDLKADPAIM